MMSPVKSVLAATFILLSLVLPKLGHATQTCSHIAPQASVAIGDTMRVFAYNVYGTNQVLFPTWASVNGQDDLIWYSGIHAGNGTWYADIDMGNHSPGSPQFGEFITHAYLYNTGYPAQFCGANSFTRPAPSCSHVAPQSPTTTATSGPFRIYAYGVPGATAVYFPTWGAVGGQDDLIWYPGTDAGGGTWYADIDLGNHKTGNPEFGIFDTHVYVFNGSAHALCSNTAFSRVHTSVPPSVTLTSPHPVGGNQARPWGQPLTLGAAANDDQGVTRVEYYANGNYVGQSSTSPYLVDFHPPAPGLYAIRALAYDVSGLSAYSDYGHAAFPRMTTLMHGIAEPNPVFLHYYNPSGTGQDPNTLPVNSFYMVVRHTEQNPAAIPVSWDFGKYDSGSTYCAFPRGDGYCTLTGLSVPPNQPGQVSYTRGHEDGTPNDTSALQQVGVEFGSFLNTFQSGCVPNLPAHAGIHSAFEMRTPYYFGSALTVFDGDPNTEFVIEAELEIPVMYTPGMYNPEGQSSVQLSLIAYFINSSNHLFGLVLTAHDSDTSHNGGPGFSHDHQSPFMGSGIGENQYISTHPRGGTYAWGTPSHSLSHGLWSGKRLFRVFITRARMQQILQANNYVGAPEDFRLYSAGVLHEIYCAGGGGFINGVPMPGNVSSAYSGRNFRVYSARYY